jgi:phenylpropionate dioxygenase-like ring-hydroxylating dioxygenase large terminal subunit
VFALRDACPHRGIPLHYGRFDGETIACCYHGWRFDTAGTCVEIPSLREGQEIDLARIRCEDYPCTERQGLVWIYFRHPKQSLDAVEPPEPPRIPVFSEEARPAAAIMLPFPCSTDHAAFGLMDPTHAAYVHTSRWFKHKASKLRPKEKEFKPIELGWQMVRHRLRRKSVYKLLGPTWRPRSPTKPGCGSRMHGDRQTVVGLTAITPITEVDGSAPDLRFAALGGSACAAAQNLHAHLFGSGPASGDPAT